MAHLLAARVHTQRGRLEDAQRALDLIPPGDITSESLSLKAYIAALRGDDKAARSIAQRLGSAPQNVPTYHLAKVSTVLGDTNQAFLYLSRAADEREAQLVFMNVDPEFASLRRDPRFSSLAKRVGLAEDR